MERILNRNKTELGSLCRTGKKLINRREYEACRLLIIDAMKNYPDAAEPHNLMGILLEKQGNHALAMRHFRAAYALNPAFEPARRNMDSFAGFHATGECSFGENTVEEVRTARQSSQDIA